MYRVEIIGGAPGATHLVQVYEHRRAAERVATALVYYFDRNQLDAYRQGAQVIDRDGRWIWRQCVGSEPERSC